MRTASGDGYTLVVIENAPMNSNLGPGLLLITAGILEVGDLKVDASLGPAGVELTGSVTVTGYGTLAVALTREEILTRGIAVRHDIVRHDKPWGYELEVPSDAKRVQLKFLEVSAGHRTSEQYHEHKDEVCIFIDTGHPVRMMVPPKMVHRVTGPRRYFEASTYHPDDVVRVSDDYGR